MGKLNFITIHFRQHPKDLNPITIGFISLKSMLENMTVNFFINYSNLLCYEYVLKVLMQSKLTFRKYHIYINNNALNQKENLSSVSSINY